MKLETQKNKKETNQNKHESNVSCFKFYGSFPKNARCSLGLTFVELIVVISIFSIVAATVFFNFSGFSTAISIENLAQQIALQVKQAQTYAISGTTNFGLTAGEAPRYGVYFNIETPTGDPKKFVSYIDLDPADKQFSDANPWTSLCQHDPNFGGQAVECLDRYTIAGGDMISALCLNEETTSPNCATAVGSNGLHISFQRPFPEATIVAPDFPGMTINDAEIKITSSKGNQKTIIISATGQISIR